MPIETPIPAIPDGEGVYLLAFFYRGRHVAYGGASPRGRALHYLGWSENIRRRIGEHITGEGSRLCRAVSLAGYELRLVRVWSGRGRDFERSLKAAHNLARVCPVCAYHLADGDGSGELEGINNTGEPGEWIRQQRLPHESES